MQNPDPLSKYRRPSDIPSSYPAPPFSSFASSSSIPSSSFSPSSLLHPSCLKPIIILMAFCFLIFSFFVYKDGFLGSKTVENKTSEEEKSVDWLEIESLLEKENLNEELKRKINKVLNESEMEKEEDEEERYPRVKFFNKENLKTMKDLFQSINGVNEVLELKFGFWNDLRKNISLEYNASIDCSLKFKNLSASLLFLSKEYQESSNEEKTIHNKIRSIEGEIEDYLKEKKEIEEDFKVVSEDFDSKNVKEHQSEIDRLEKEKDYLSHIIEQISKEIKETNNTIKEKREILRSKINNQNLLNEEHKNLSIKYLDESQIYDNMKTRIEEFALSEEIFSIILGDPASRKQKIKELAGIELERLSILTQMKNIIKTNKMGKQDLNLEKEAKEIQSNFSSSMSKLINITRLINDYYKSENRSSVLDINDVSANIKKIQFRMNEINSIMTANNQSILTLEKEISNSENHREELIKNQERNKTKFFSDQEKMKMHIGNKTQLESSLKTLSDKKESSLNQTNEKLSKAEKEHKDLILKEKHFSQISKNNQNDIIENVAKLNKHINLCATKIAYSKTLKETLRGFDEEIDKLYERKKELERELNSTLGI